jgi:hypothetical protein
MEPMGRWTKGALAGLLGRMKTKDEIRKPSAAIAGREACGTAEQVKDEADGALRVSSNLREERWAMFWEKKGEIWRENEKKIRANPTESEQIRVNQRKMPFLGKRGVNFGFCGNLEMSAFPSSAWERQINAGSISF